MEHSHVAPSRWVESWQYVEVEDEVTRGVEERRARQAGRKLA